MRSMWGGAVAVLLAACATGEHAAQETTALVRLAGPAEASAVLTSADDYLGALTLTDLSLKAQTATPISREAYLALLAEGAVEWTPAERLRMEALFQRHADRLAALRPWLPEQILVAKSGPALEAGAAHTRGAAIFMGDSLPDTEIGLDRLFFHELFHVLSRHNPRAHDDLYAAVGYQPCINAPTPADVGASLITNPDAVVSRHVIPLELADAERLVMPLLLARPDRYDPVKGGAFFQYVSVELLEVAQDAEGRCAPVLADGEPHLFAGPEVLAALKAATGGNTSYLIHPEETTADTFVLMILGLEPANPAPVQKLEAVIKAGPPARS